MVAASQPAMRKLVDNRQINTRELFQFGELLKAARDRQLDRYLDIRDGMSERMQNQRIVIELSVQVARAARKRRQMIAGLEIMAEHYPNEPLYSLMLLDYYFPSRKYDEAFQALQRLSDRLGGEDAAMDARFSAAALVMGNLQDAKKYADAALQREPDLELGWWSALNVRAAMDDFSACVEALQHLESEFDYDLGPEKLKKNKTYAQLVQSDEYKSWVESRQ
jgi:tetratricopeptide (TPR) repeat protein